MAVVLRMLAVGALLIAALSAQADHIQQRGGQALASKIGPWYIMRGTYEDGSRVCQAGNFSCGRNTPVFSYMAAVGGKDPVSIMRFDADKPAKAGDTVQLAIGEETIVLHHGATAAGNAFFPKTTGDARKITQTLLARERAPQKYFFVIDKWGDKFKFDARSTAKMLEYMEGQCGYKRW